MSQLFSWKHSNSSALAVEVTNMCNNTIMLHIENILAYNSKKIYIIKHALSLIVESS